MRSLLNEQYAPLTYQIGFLEADFETVSRAYLNWRKALQPELKTFSADESLASALVQLEPLTTPSTKELLISTRSRWTAFFSNGLRSCDPESPIGHLCTLIPCKGVVVHCVRDRSTVTDREALRVYGAVSFTLFSPYATEWLNQERYICAMNDGGKWVFLVQGEPQWFEHPEQYTAREISQRFTPAVLEEYCLALGIRLFDDSFYEGKALISEIPNQLSPGSVAMSLADARRKTLVE